MATTVCYNPAACKQMSNCSSIPSTVCENHEHQLELLDQFFFSIRKQWCKGITCCEVVSCSVSNNSQGLFSPPVSPPPPLLIEEQSPTYRVLWVYFPFVFGILFTLLLCVLWRRFQQKNQMVSQDPA